MSPLLQYYGPMPLSPSFYLQYGPLPLYGPLPPMALYPFYGALLSL
jgi:hypothetical protein